MSMRYSVAGLLLIVFLMILIIIFQGVCEFRKPWRLSEYSLYRFIRTAFYCVLGTC